MYLTDSEEARLLTLSMTATRLALVTALGSETTAGTEVTGGSYVRAAVSAGTPSSAGIKNANAVTFFDLPACNLVGWELWTQDGTQRRWFGYWSPTATIWNTGLFTTSTPHGLNTGDGIVFVAGQQPAGLTPNVAYYVRDVTSTTFKVASAPLGAAVSVTGSGSTTYGRVLVIPAGESFQVPPNGLLLAMD